jgi:hypothetical protein
MKSFFCLNEIESSPFFTASWEPRFLKKLLIVFGSCLIAYISFTLVSIDTYCTVPMLFTGKSYQSVLANLSSLSLPILVVVTPSTKNELFVSHLESDKEFNETGIRYGSKNSQTVYEIWDYANLIKFELSSNSSKMKCEIRIQNPKVKVTEYFIKVICFVICLSTVILCFKVPSLRQFTILYLIITLYSFFELPIFCFSKSTSAIINMLFFFGYISISFLMVRILSSNIPIIYSSLFGICGLCAFTTFLTFSNSKFFIPSSACLLVLIGVSIHLFYIGTLIISPFLLFAHFGWMWGVGLSVYVTTILKNMTIKYSLNFMVNIISDILVSVFVVFQSIYLIGEPSKAKIPEAPLDQQSKIKRIDHLIESLTEKEDGGIKRSGSFQ